jgi:hypothetical protein
MLGLKPYLQYLGGLGITSVSTLAAALFPNVSFPETQGPAVNPNTVMVTLVRGGAWASRCWRT